MNAICKKVAPLCSILIFVLIGAPYHAPAQDASQDQATPADASSMQTELPSDVDPNSPLAQIIHLAQSGVDESVLISYAGNSPTPFNLTADQIIYLKDIGVPDTVVQAMIQRDQQLGAADNTTPSTQPAPETAPPSGDVTSDYFYGALAPYGGWVNINGFGLCWRPTAVVYNSGWQPYCDHGHWVDTDDGWFWASDYSWGWATFHYGRWFHDARWGWCWWPDTDWAPSWVCWRYSDSYCGWAPLPPHAIYRSGVGFVYNGITVGANFDFGISANFFAFVPIGRFCDPHPDHFRVDAAHVPAAYHQTTVINNFDVHNNVFANHGIDPQRIATVTRVPIHPVAIQESSSPVMRGAVVTRNQTLVINRPHFTGTAVTTMHQGVAPREVNEQNVSHAWYVTQPQPNNSQRPEMGQPNRSAPTPPAVNENANHQQPYYYQRPATTQPANTWSAPRQTYQTTPPESQHNQQTPERTPPVNEPPVRTAPEQPAQTETPYRENPEPMPQYNNSQSQRYSTPRAQDQAPRESAPTESHSAPSQPAPQQQRQQQGQGQGQQQGQNPWQNKNGH